LLLVTEIPEMRKIVTEWRRAGGKIGFVPTMGFFHQGHLALMERARAENDHVVVSLFVNPTQFGPGEDFARYPRDLERDRRLAEAAGVDVLFHPAPEEMYLAGYQTYVEVTGVSQGLCGASRPGHFRGVATVVTKLFNIVTPDRAYFGEKDAQQLRVIKRMVADLNLPVEIRPVPTVREEDGLAMSSRNTYLSPEERRQAIALYQSLLWAKERVAEGERDAARLVEGMQRIIAGYPLVKLEYLEFRDDETLAPLAELKGKVLIAIAARVGTARLIDNITVDVATGTHERGKDDAAGSLPE
jgi:pantoate--beta-alanine ligase